MDSAAGGSRRYNERVWTAHTVAFQALGQIQEVFLLIRAALDRLNLRIKPADAALEGGVLAREIGW